MDIAYWRLDVNRSIEVRRDPSWRLWREERRGEERDWGNYWREDSIDRETTAVQQRPMSVGAYCRTLRVFISHPAHTHRLPRVVAAKCPNFAHNCSTPYDVFGVCNVMYLYKQKPVPF